MSYILIAEFDRQEELPEWEIWSGDPTHVTITGGELIVGTNSTAAADGIILVHRDLVEFQELNKYTTTLRAKQIAEPAGLVCRFWAGFLGIAADGATVVDAVGGTNPLLGQFYHAADGEILSQDGYDEHYLDIDGYKNITGYTEGFSDPGSTGVSSDVNLPSTVHPDVKYLRPMLICNGNSLSGGGFFRAGIVAIDTYTLEVFSWTPGVGTVLSAYAIVPQSTTAVRGQFFSSTITATHFTDGALFWEIVPVTGTLNALDFYGKLADGINVFDGQAVLELFLYPAFVTGVYGETETVEESFYIRIRTGSLTGPIVAQTPTILIPEIYEWRVTLPVGDALIDETTEDDRAQLIKITCPKLAQDETVHYRITGVQLADILAMAINGGSLFIPTSLTGTFPYQAANGSLVYIAINVDNLTEGTEFLKFELYDPVGDQKMPWPLPSITLEILDTSQGIPVYEEPGAIPEPPAFTVAGLQIRDKYNRLTLDTSDRMSKLYGAYYFPVNAGWHYIDLPGENTGTGEWSAHCDDQWVYFNYAVGYISCYQPTTASGTFTVNITKQ